MLVLVRPVPQGQGHVRIALKLLPMPVDKVPVQAVERAGSGGLARIVGA